jgi:predicted metalloenzyme YecM
MGVPKYPPSKKYPSKKWENVKEIHIDATYKTAKGRFELYAIVGQFQGSVRDLLWH